MVQSGAERETDNKKGEKERNKKHRSTSYKNIIPVERNGTICDPDMAMK